MYRANRFLLPVLLSVVMLANAGSHVHAAPSFFDDFESGVIDTNPNIPNIGTSWFNSGNLTRNTIQANPLVDNVNGSSKVLSLNRSLITDTAGYSWIDISPADQDLLSIGQLLTVELKFYQPVLIGKNSLNIGMYDNGNHGFSNNAIDLGFFSTGIARWWDNNVGNYVTIDGAVASGGWDTIKVVVDFTADNWSLQINGGTAYTQPFTSHNDMSKVQTMFVGAVTSNSLAYVDDITVTIGSTTTVPGDFDADGDVDGADFVAWQTNFPKASGAMLSEGDADGDGDVDGADFVVWQTNFPFTPSSSVAPVPEPHSIVLAAIGMILTVSACRKWSRE